MLTSSALYKQAIHRPDQRAFRVDLYTADGDIIQRGIKPIGGSVSATMDKRVTRTADLTLPAEFWPDLDASAALTPYQTVAKIFGGARYGNGSEELFQLIEGRVGDVTRNANGTVSARIDDRAADVVGFNFEQPRNSERIPLLTQIRQLITEVLPTAAFGPDDVSTTAQTPKLTWDESRGDALDTLAGALGARWYQLGNGSFVVRLLPYDVGTPVQDIFDGVDGLLSTAQINLTRDGAANSVTVVVERADGGTPLRVTVRDTSPSSPTRFGGPFGRISKIIKVQTPLTNGQALAMARKELNAATALSSQWNVTCKADYTLEPGDTIRLRSRTANGAPVMGTQIIDRIDYPLDTSLMQLSTRAFVRALATT